MGALNLERINIMLLNRLAVLDAVLVLTDGFSVTATSGSGVLNGIFGLTSVSNTDTTGQAILTGEIYLSGEGETKTTADASFAVINVLVNGVSDTLSEFAGRIGVYQEIEFEYIGDLQVGEVLKIDADKFTATLDGANVIDKFDGDWPVIAPGSTLIAYSDDEPARSVKITVKHKDKHI